MIRFVGGAWDGKEIREAMAGRYLEGPFSGRYELAWVVKDLPEMEVYQEYRHDPSFDRAKEYPA